VDEEPAENPKNCEGVPLGAIICDSRRLQREMLAKALCALDPNLYFSFANAYEDTRLELTKSDFAAVIVAQVEGSGGSIRVIKRLRQQFPDMPVILFADVFCRDTVVDAFRVGVRGVISRDDSLDVLLECLQTVCRGDIWAQKRELSFILDALSASGYLQTKNALGQKLLTAREEQVATLVTSGLSNREISRTLQLSENTVRNYLLHIYDKLGISKRVELVRYRYQCSARDSG
jgi:DNA-binding NarL/FixJ family response regulator